MQVVKVMFKLKLFMVVRGQQKKVFGGPAVNGCWSLGTGQEHQMCGPTTDPGLLEFKYFGNIGLFLMRPEKEFKACTRPPEARPIGRKSRSIGVEGSCREPEIS